jgi:hypothetical protein
MSLGGASGYTNFADPAQGGGGGKGGANLPSLIDQPLPQFTGDDPYSQIMAMTPAFRNPYANLGTGNALGGFDPSIYARGMQGDPVTGGGGGGGGASPIMGGVSVGNAPLVGIDPYDQAGQAAIDKIGRDIVDTDDELGYLTGNTPEPITVPVDDDELGYITGADDELGYLTGNNPEPVLVPANPSDFGAVDNDGGGDSYFVPANPSDFGAVDDSQIAAVQPAPMPMAYEPASYNYVSDAPATDVLAADAPTTDVPVYGGDFRGEMGGDLGGDDGQDMGEDSFDTAGYAKGGMIRGLLGPNPKGPDDGFAMVQRGEYVIKKSAVNKYGRGLLDMINEGKVPAKKIKSLLD